ncbi:aminodeoxychorismate/anthranilate synthase component II [Candidatus Gottesmanbacteria bacterium RIFCSPHIGHO2_02_FULL_40_13]|uniref:Aminodeoxychorismate/anthranilate synthase component II n=1 Tax=Candidatus Gottesmanbacteria bacterium RIFCSPHIGHO2_02_FULL_40_13 TaxID=1798384 RepID=A0A1F6A5E4_9BACT|nr:MAG: aminodeoxychorismate/anthranilate synthase component II [Candidatus Gottesmanbacteria bacterium RIFCSPHIGHO2_02_FULL_40_13]
MKVLIIDNYDSFTYNLYQLIGELGGSPVVVRNDAITLRKIKNTGFSHIVISPGPGDPSDDHYFGICREAILRFGYRIPTLGICLGHQGIIQAYGGKIIRAPLIKHGKTSVIKHNQKGLFENVKNPLVGMRYHSLIGHKELLPNCLEITAYSSDDQEIMAVKHHEFPVFGMQFHPESIGTENGREILKNFLSIEVAPLRGATS